MAVDSASRRSVLVFRVLATLTLGLGTVYLIWRYAASLNRGALWFAVPLVAAETYAFVTTVLFVVMMWRPARRSVPPPIDGARVDVFITTYNEPVELVRLTAAAALRIDWPSFKVYVLDDGARPRMREAAEALGAAYITRGEEWTGKPRHAKAGNVNNALERTAGEFILILDADQIPDPRIVRRTIGYFRDPTLAFVQTPQHFYNVPPGDPFGSDAPIFYGPILRGKDGWNSAFFCGSNAILRREALEQLGVTEYVREMEQRFERTLTALRRRVGALGRRAGDLPAAEFLHASLETAHNALRSGAPLQRVSEIVRQGLTVARDMASQQDILDVTATLQELADAGDLNAAETRRHLLETLGDLPDALKRDPSVLGLSEADLGWLDLTRAGEAQPVLPLATNSVTEDMATAMRLHALGWKSAFHPEVLAYGLAPEDLRSALGQRLRWAQGTLQVLFQENPLFKRGLNVAQRIQYFTTMVSYFDGFASLVFLASPIVCLLSGLSPIRAPWLHFLAWVTPYLAVNRLMYFHLTRGLNAWRSEQYSLALFPLWIRAVIGTALHPRIDFVVTPKRRQSGNYLALVWPQLLVIALTIVAIVCGIGALAITGRGSIASVSMNVFWGGYNVAMLLSIVRAAVFRPPAGWKPEPPAYLVATT